MTELAYTDADLQLFADLQRAAGAANLAPCLIGAGAIRLGALEWKVRLGRRTLDWDFAVRVDSWEAFDRLSERLTAEGAGFECTRVPHRFAHVAGGLLDVVPHGGLEQPAGKVEWADGSSMSTLGFAVLDEHFEVLTLETSTLRAASLPAVVGLKLLAYEDRRPGITRDLADAYRVLQDVEDSVSDDRVVAEGLERLRSEEVTFGAIGTYLLGRDIGRIFPGEASERMIRLLEEPADPESPMPGDATRPWGGAPRSRADVIRRLEALRLGILDGADPGPRVRAPGG